MTMSTSPQQPKGGELLEPTLIISLLNTHRDRGTDTSVTNSATIFLSLISYYYLRILIFVEIMAEALVAGAFLSGFINVVFDRLISPEAANLIAGKKLDRGLVERLKTALCGAKALLADAERKQFDNPNVKEWLDSLKDAVYKADDSLDHVFTKAATENKLSTSLPRLLNFKDRKIVNKIEVELRRIEDILKQKDNVGLKEVVAGDNYSSWRTPSTCLVQGKMYGREGDQEAIMKIINDESSEHQLSVIPIVGMGGVGKTTLAQWLYSNVDLKLEGFDLKAWVCISEQFDIVEVTKSIIEGITNSTCNLKDFNSLQLDLKEKLSTRKFFIVLDDVWSDDHYSWKNFKTPFQYGAKGSTILMTTRSEDVASVFQTCSPYSLDGLSDVDCWSVFADNAGLPESNGSSALEKIGRRIVERCKGLPLAAETLGCLLRTEREVKEWEDVLVSDIWGISNSKIIPALLISYYHLPAHLKGCFVYCSLFPKDHEFDKDELILLWMAEDLLPPPKGGDTLEKVGKKCFDGLASRLFFKKIVNPLNNERFVMHDLFHDLAMILAGDFYCRLEELGKADGMSIQTRHLSYGSLSRPISRNFDSIDKVEFLRTFLRFNFFPPSFSIERTPHIILSKLKYLRVLSFRGFQELELLPDSIGKLIHLRYLDLSHTSIQTLPESLCGLFNLQTLKLFYCRNLVMLPSSMHNLVNLRHLDIRNTQLREMPSGLSKLKHLHVIGGSFAVGKQKGSAGIKELGELSIHGGTLELTNLENVANCDEAMGARLMDKTHVDKLILKWSYGGDIVSNMQTEKDIFDKLQPHHGLKMLRVYGYSGTRFPNWVGHSSYHNMTRVSLVSCTSCRMLPPLGQLPFLESLKIEGFDGLKNIGVEFYKNEDDNHSSSSISSPFPSLVDLTFQRMPCWEVWSPYDSNNAFPRLERLSIWDCRRLKGDLPNHLPAIRELDISESDKMGFQVLPLSLQRLSIGGCQQVESLFKAMNIDHTTCLEGLTVSDCSSATSLPWDCLSQSLRTLSIYNCRNLEFTSQQQQQKHKLVTLGLYDSCDSLTLFQLEAFPNLKHLGIKGCENLESISLSGSQHAALYRFEIERCKKLKSLPSHMNTLLPNLEYLKISECPDMDSFPEGGLPPSLKKLDVKKCEKLLSNLSSMGVLEALTDLEIDGGDCESIKSFPNEGLLPELPSLTSLCLSGFSNMETLESKELLRLTSLQQLKIKYCPKLRNIAGERLPHSLLKLEIYECQLLAKRCKNKHRKIWPKISHIPGVKVDDRWVS